MLADRDWIGGEDMTAADVTYRLATLFASTLTAAPPEELKSLAAWIARMDARPSVAAIAKSVAAVARQSRLRRQERRRDVAEVEHEPRQR